MTEKGFFDEPSPRTWFQEQAEAKKNARDKAEAALLDKARKLSLVSKELAERLIEKGVKPAATVVKRQPLSTGLLTRAVTGYNRREKVPIDVGNGWVVSLGGASKASKQVVVLMEDGGLRLGMSITEPKPKPGEKPPEEPVLPKVEDLGSIDLAKYPFHVALEDTTSYMTQSHVLAEGESSAYLDEVFLQTRSNMNVIEDNLRTSGRELLGIKEP